MDKSRAAPVFDEESDYVVLGAGSAGCVLANRLTQPDGGVKDTVTLLEAGPPDRGVWDWWKIHMPAALTYNLNDDKYNWAYNTVPQKHAAGRVWACPRGRVLGGSSSLNAMVYARGHALDFERWAQEGADGWDYAHILPYYRRAQCHADGASPYRGVDGPLHVRTRRQGEFHDLFEVFERAGVEAGYPHSDDLNGARGEGFGAFDMTVTPLGQRCNTSSAYLQPALEASPEQLTVHTNAVVQRVIMDTDASGAPRAVGVEYRDRRTGRQQRVRARKEVILSMGAIGSPQVLMLSGVGDADHLRAMGVEALVHNPQVGANLQDHTEVYMQMHCKKPVTLYPVGTWAQPHRRAWAGLQWLAAGSGPCATNHFDSGGFIRTRAGLPHPDVQFHFIPGAVQEQAEFLPYHAFQVHTGTMRPRSRGTVRLASGDASDAPLIDPNYYAEQADVDDMIAAMRLTVEIMAQPAFDAYRGDPIAPQAVLYQGLVDGSATDAEVGEWVRQNSHSSYHVSCTCAMGSVVDHEGRVLGVDGLRVVDASVMPSMTSGNLNAPTIMLAEKLADHIRGVTPLPPDTSAKWELVEGWETSQRGGYAQAGATPEEAR